MYCSLVVVVAVAKVWPVDTITHIGQIKVVIHFFLRKVIKFYCCI